MRHPSLLTRLLSLRLAAVAAITFVVILSGATPAFAQDAVSDLGVQRAAVRKLSGAEKARLKAALARWKSLPADKRAALRKKAKELGRDRLEQLAGRGNEAKKLTKRHRWLEEEHRRIRELIGPGRFASLPKAEQAYLAYEAKRRFQSHCVVAMLRLTESGTLQQLQALPPEERRAKRREALQQVVDRLLAELPDAERARILSLSPRQQRKERRRLMDEFRERETINFAARFDRGFLMRYFQETPETRKKRVDRFARHARWYEVRRLLEKELGIPKETVALIKTLRADEHAILRREYEDTKDLTRPERRLRLETKIRELYGRAALDPTRRGGRAKRRRRADDERRTRRPTSLETDR